MSICKRYKMLKTTFKFTVGVLLFGCLMCYQIGWHRGASYTSQTVSDELLEACESAIEKAETRCLEQF